MNCILKNCNVLRNGKFQICDLFVSRGIFVSSADLSPSDATVFDFNGAFVFPGLADVHVHLREPGFLYKETIKSGTEACAAGGYTAVCSMPNLNPCPDSVENLGVQLEAIEKDACIRVYPFGAISVGEMGEKISDLEGMAKNCIGFSDDGRGVQSEEMMCEAMLRSKALGKIISAHCEDNSLLFGGYIHDGEYCRAHGHKGICSESEWKPIARDIELLKRTGASYHVCHISTKESVELIRQAKAEGLDITCETAPHYLVLCDGDLQDDGRFKMNPPLRSRQDREALVEGFLDGTIDMIATDHAPHSAEEKSKGLSGSNMGVVGIETAMAVMYTNFVKNGRMSLEELLEKMCFSPRRRFGIQIPDFEYGSVANFTVFDFGEMYKINPVEFKSKGRSTPFEDAEVFGRCLMTVCDGKIVYKR